MTDIATFLREPPEPEPEREPDLVVNEDTPMELWFVTAATDQATIPKDAIWLPTNHPFIEVLARPAERNNDGQKRSRPRTTEDQAAGVSIAAVFRASGTGKIH